MLDEIIRAAWRGPTSINAQEILRVVVKDATKRARIAEIAGAGFATRLSAGLHCVGHHSTEDCLFKAPPHRCIPMLTGSICMRATGKRRKTKKR